MANSPDTSMNSSTPHSPEFIAQFQHKAASLGLQHLSSSSIHLHTASQYFLKWLANHFHGDMNYMAKHGDKRYYPEKLIEGTVSVITCQLNYHRPDNNALAQLNNPARASIAQYALGRDYHKVLRKQLNELGKWLQSEIPDLQFRAFVDSAPVLERALNQQSGLGFFGKNTMIIHPKRGSFFFLGELFINQPIDISHELIDKHCGHCQRCLDICPTKAIVAPYQLDARRCISYLTIEYYGAFPHQYRRAIGNRIFGCDDCQLVCPWNRFSPSPILPDFLPRHQLDCSDLRTLFNWDETTFIKRTEGSPIRRLGYQRWLRNLAIGLGNDHYHKANIDALEKTKILTDDVAVLDHIHWALAEQHSKKMVD